MRVLEEIDSDRAKAIVKCVETVTSLGPEKRRTTEIVPIGDNSSVLIVGRCRSLERIPWLRLVEVTPSRFLLAVPAGTTIAGVEVALLDLIETLPEEEHEERDQLMELRQHLSQHRRQEQVNTLEIFLLGP